MIVITYVRDLTVRDAEQFWRALRPAGIVVYENGADTTNSVLKAFLRYQILRFEDVLTNPEWNPENRIRVQRLIAQKTARTLVDVAIYRTRVLDRPAERAY